MTVDPTGNRLATGGVDGSIKIWNFGTGQELKHKYGSRYSESSKVISIHYAIIKNALCLLVCHQSNIIKIYHVDYLIN